MTGFWQKLKILQSVQNYFPKSLKLVFADFTLMKFLTLRGGMFIFVAYEFWRNVLLVIKC